MTMLPKRFQINDEMPTLGQLVREAIQPEPCKYRAFEERKHCVSYDVPGYEVTGKWIEEKDCRQIKGPLVQSGILPNGGKWSRSGKTVECSFEFQIKEKPVASLKDFEQRLFEDWLRKECPSGDVESVQAQWLASTEYEEFFDEYLAEPAKPLHGEWRDCSEDMPDLPAGKYQVLLANGRVFQPICMPLRAYVYNILCKYREIP